MRTIAIVLSIGLVTMGCGEEAPARKAQPAQEPVIETPVTTPVTSEVTTPVVTDPNAVVTTPATTGSLDIAALMASNPQFAQLIASNPQFAAYLAALAANNPTSTIPVGTSPGGYSYSYTCMGTTCIVTENGVTKTIPISELKALPKN